jgi:recombination associated protein RdgC
MLTQALQIKKVAFQEGVFDDSASAQGDDRFDADVALSTGELRVLITDLIDALGGEVEATAVTDQAPTAATLPAATPATAVTADGDGPPF